MKVYGREEIFSMAIYKKSFGEKFFEIALNSIMVLIMASMLYPLLNVLALSFSDVYYVVRGDVKIIPRGFNIEAYKYVFSQSSLLLYYWNTVKYAVGGTVIMLIVTSMIAYPLTISDFPLKKIITIMFIITMFFSGGLIPTYIIMRNYGLINTYWVMVLPGAVAAWHTMIFRTFFQQLPKDLTESAYIDGANDIIILFKIILPLSKPLLATFSLFSIVSHWNGWFNAFIYLTDSKKHPIQMLLRELLINLQMSNQGLSQIESELINLTVFKNALIIVTILPILFVYPFLQKYFAKGVLIGSLKG